MENCPPLFGRDGRAAIRPENEELGGRWEGESERNAGSIARQRNRRGNEVEAVWYE